MYRKKSVKFLKTSWQSTDRERRQSSKVATSLVKDLAINLIDTDRTYSSQMTSVS